MSTRRADRAGVVVDHVPDSIEHFFQQQRAVASEAPVHPAATAAALSTGELYDNILRDAWTGDSNAIAFLAAYTNQPLFRDSLVAAQHAAVLAALLRRVGDTTFSRAVRGEGVALRASILAALTRSVGEDIATHFPTTAALRPPS